MNNFVTLGIIQHVTGNRPLKGPALRSADKCTTLLQLAWLIKPVFHLRIFFVWSNFLLNSHLLATFFEVKKVGSNPTFYCFQTKKVVSSEKICKWKTSFNIKYVNKNFVNFIQRATASHIWLWSYEMMLNELSSVSGLIDDGHKNKKGKGTKIV